MLVVCIETATITEKPQMRDARWHHSVAIVANFAYIIAGTDPSTNQPVMSVERYDIIAEKWALVPSEFDQFSCFALSITCDNRYILSFGGSNRGKFFPKSTLIRRFDHLHPTGGWAVINLENGKPCRAYYGLLRLEESD